jgi:hypothetical protein
METDLKELERMISGVNNDIDELRSKKITVKDSELPSNLKIMLSGISDSKAIEFLFSNNIDKMLEKLFSLFLSGDMNTILDNKEKIKEIFSDLGFGEGSFEGPVSKRVIMSINASINSGNFSKLENNMMKALFVVKNLERESKNIKGKREKQKYDEAVSAVKQLLRFVSKIYQNRKLVNNKVLRGLSHIVKEDTDPNERIVAIE